MSRLIKVSGWMMMTLLAVMISLVSSRYFITFDPSQGGPQFGEKFAGHLPVLLLHIFGGVLALFLGPWQFWGGFRNRYLRLHRWVGRVYLTAVLIGAVAGLYMAAIAFGGLPSSIGFAALAVLWLTTAVMAYLRIRRGDVERHREWMIRNYALTFAAVTLRLWIPLFLSLGFAFVEAYITVAWLCWVPNLLLAELYLGLRGGRREQRKGAPGIRRASQVLAAEAPQAGFSNIPEAAHR